MGQAKKSSLLEWVRVPLQEMLKPVSGEAPASHWNCVVGGVRMQPREEESVMAWRSVSARSYSKEKGKHTSAVDTVLGFCQALANTVLTVR